MEIPSPPGRFLVGNQAQLNQATATAEFTRLALEHAPLFQLKEPGARYLVASGFPVVDELCDETRFDKGVQLDLAVAREIVGDGLFTAKTQEPNWSKAHNILLPCFSRQAILQYLPQMEEILRQMLVHWDRAAEEGQPVDVPEDMTRLMLDVVGLCGFGYRYGSFTNPEPDPMIGVLANAISDIGDYFQTTALASWLMPRKRRLDDRARLYAWVDDLVRARRQQGPSQSNDLLSLMLGGVDKKSGERLDDLNIRNQIITFLFAGHETTSSLVSSALYELVKHPNVLARAVEEVDAVLGQDRPLQGADIPRFEYLARLLRETLRLWPPVTTIQFVPYEDTVVMDRYSLKKGEPVVTFIPALHRDPQIWGPQAEEFDPDRFLPEAEAARPANCYKPFGNGQRSCLGRQFAMQEAVATLALVLQRYQLIDYSDYQLQLTPLSSKPDGFKLKLARRVPQEKSSHQTGLLVLFGSEMSASEGFARRLGQEGLRLGFDAKVAALDEYVDRLPRTGLVALVTSTYNGRPPENAARFYQWALSATNLTGVNYVVFGCGNREWAATYQAIPKALDAALEKAGATRLVERGEADAGRDFDGDFERWQEALWPALAERLGLTLTPSTHQDGPRFELEVLADEHPNPFVPAFAAVPMTVIENRELQAEGSGRSTRHLEVALPPGVTYQTGDHLGVIARQGAKAVARAAAHFGFTPETRVRLKKRDNEKTVLPLDQIVSVGSLLRDYLELGEVATRRNLEVLASVTACPRAKASLLNEEHPHKSVLDLLEEHPACELPFERYLELLPPLRPRYYSISSSALASPRLASVSVGVVEGPHHSGRGRFEGVCSNYLAGHGRGDALYAFVRQANATFRLPRSPATPVIMVGPGTGVAPFRGFLQERAKLRAQGKGLGKAILFFGCRHPDQDFIYKDELEGFAKDGVAELEVAFSRQGEGKVYVQDRVRARGDDVWQMLEAGGHIYICGDGNHMAPAVREAFGEIYRGKTGQDPGAWITGLMEQERYLLDVWAG